MALDSAVESGVMAWPDWPNYGLVDDIRPQMAALAEDGQAFALATLVSVEGSSPRPLGSQMVIAADGRVWGYVSGGCVEADVAVRAREVLRTGTPELVHYGRDSGNWDIQLTCGGRIGVFIQTVAGDDPALHTVLRAREDRRSVSLVVCLDSGALRTVRPLDLESTAAEEGGLIRGGRNSYFVKHYTPALRLLIVGSDPVALALIRLGTDMGIEVHVSRPSGPDTPPGGAASYSAGPVQAFLDAMKFDPWTAVVCVSHDLDLDHAVLARALASTAFYVGALGSRRWRDDRLARLNGAGLSDAAISRLRTPVGFSIGARSAHEIALSILSEIVSVRDGA